MSNSATRVNVDGARAPATAARAPGRPRRPDVEQRVLDAAIRLLAERGIEGTTMSAVVERSGVARATVYLRWPNRQALLTAAIRRAMGRPVLKGTDDVERDIRAGAERVREIFGSPSFRSVFPAVVAALTHDGPEDATITYDVIAPGRMVLADVYRRLAAAQGFRDDVSPELVIDLVTGANIGHYLATGQAPSEAIGHQILEIVFDGLRRRL